MKNKRILLVDDDESNRLLVTLNLKKFNMEIIEAVDGIDALNKLKENKNFDLILMDIRMPNMDGVEVSNIIINEMKLNIPIIIMSASTDIYNMSRMYDVGITSYILKPITKNKFLNIIINNLK